MKLLHTADWHVGKVLKGFSRHEEHGAALGALVRVADRERVDVVLVAGDLFESTAPPPPAQELVWRTLLDLRETGAEVVVLGGNHDPTLALDAQRALAGAAGITVVGTPRRPADGGVRRIATRSGEQLDLAVLPWVSPRGSIRTEQLLSQDVAQLGSTFEERMRRIIDALCAPLGADAVRVLLLHAFVRGGRMGGGERDAQTVEMYGVPAAAFPGDLHLVALGHLHRQQSIPAPSPCWYPGSPIAVDFGEEAESGTKGGLLVEAAAGTPARVTPVALPGGRPLRTVTGTLDELAALAPGLGDALVRVRVREQARAGLAETVRELIPLALDVRIDTPARLQGARRADGAAADGRAAAPDALFASYLDGEGATDERVVALFRELTAEAGITDEPAAPSDRAVGP